MILLDVGYIDVYDGVYICLWGRIFRSCFGREDSFRQV